MFLKMVSSHNYRMAPQEMDLVLISLPIHSLLGKIRHESAAKDEDNNCWEKAIVTRSSLELNFWSSMFLPVNRNSIKTIPGHDCDKIMEGKYERQAHI
jgi:hypothetical protein